jgi:tricarboxylate carrier
MDFIRAWFGPAPTPPFSLEAASRFPQDTYVGRCRHFSQLISPSNLFISDAELTEAQKQLSAFQAAGGRNSAAFASLGLSDEQLWRAKLVRDSILHPDSGQSVPLPFRMSAFAPVNIPIVAGMIYAAPTIGNTIFWQWINQSANVAVNYANRNASNEMSNEQILKAYGAAVATSCSLAVGLGYLTKHSKSALIPKFVPFVSVATAGALNVLLMRRSEAEFGIAVKDHEGKERGQSKRAGEMALQQVFLLLSVYQSL